MLNKTTDDIFNKAMLDNVDWQIKKINDDIFNKSNQVDELEKKEIIIKGFSGKVLSEVFMALMSVLLTTFFLINFNLTSILYFKYLVPIVTFALSLAVWFRIKNDYHIVRDTDYNSLVNDIKKVKTSISNLKAKKMELVEMRNLIKSRISDAENKSLHFSVTPIVRYGDEYFNTKAKVYSRKHWHF